MLKYCSIGSGSSGNCHVVSYKDTGILIDAGLAGKRITSGIEQADFDIDKIQGIFITHEHSDHIKGAGIMSRKLDIPIYANFKTWCGMKDKIGNIKEENMIVFDNDKTYELGELKIRPFSIPHDSEDAVGYNIYSNKEKMSIATDIGYITDNIRNNLKGSKLVEGGTESILLAHLSKENNFPELAYATTKNVLTKNEMIIGKDLTLDVLSRDKVSKVYEL